MSKAEKKYKKRVKYEITKTTEELTGTKIKYNSASYSLLCYSVMKSRMKNSSFSISDISYVLAGKLKSPSNAKRAVDVLLAAGCIKPASDSTWVATEYGIKVRSMFAWYGDTTAANRLYNSDRARYRIKKEISWEDEIEINF